VPGQIRNDRGRERNDAATGVSFGRTEAVTAARQLVERSRNPDGTRVEVDIGAAQCSKFTPSQAGEHCKQDECPVAGVNRVGDDAYQWAKEEYLDWDAWGEDPLAMNAVAFNHVVETGAQAPHVKKNRERRRPRRDGTEDTPTEGSPCDPTTDVRRMSAS
jgi:hypothetical protein